MKNRRSLTKNKKQNNNIVIMGANSAGLSSKKKSFESIIDNRKPSIFFLQETKMKRQGKIKIEGYQIYELVRSEK